MTSNGATIPVATTSRPSGGTVPLGGEQSSVGVTTPEELDEPANEEEPADMDAVLDVPPAEEVCDVEDASADDGAGADVLLADMDVEETWVLVTPAEEVIDELEREPAADEPLEDRSSELDAGAEVDTVPLLPAPDTEPDEDEEPGGSVVGRGAHARTPSAQARGAATAVVRIGWR